MKELLKSDSICKSYALMKKGPVFDLQCPCVTVVHFIAVSTKVNPFLQYSVY